MKYERDSSNHPLRFKTERRIVSILPKDRGIFYLSLCHAVRVLILSCLFSGKIVHYLLIDI